MEKNNMFVICRFSEVIEWTVLAELLTASVAMTLLIIIVNITTAINAPILHIFNNEETTYDFVEGFIKHDGCLDMNTLIASTIIQQSRETITQNQNTSGHVDILRKIKPTQNTELRLTKARIKFTRDINHTVISVSEEKISKLAVQIFVQNFTSIITVISIPSYYENSLSLIDAMVFGAMGVLLASTAVGAYGISVLVLHINAFRCILNDITMFHMKEYNNSTTWREAILSIQWLNLRRSNENDNSAWPGTTTADIYMSYNNTVAYLYDNSAPIQIGDYRYIAGMLMSDARLYTRNKYAEYDVALNSEERDIVHYIIKHEAIWAALKVQTIQRYINNHHGFAP